MTMNKPKTKTARRKLTISRETLKLIADARLRLVNGALAPGHTGISDWLSVCGATCP
jgi:hypothetical protein